MFLTGYDKETRFEDVARALLQHHEPSYLESSAQLFKRGNSKGKVRALARTRKRERKKGGMANSQVVCIAYGAAEFVYGKHLHYNSGETNWWHEKDGYDNVDGYDCEAYAATEWHARWRGAARLALVRRSYSRVIFQVWGHQSPWKDRCSGRTMLSMRCQMTVARSCHDFARSATMQGFVRVGPDPGPKRQRAQIV